MQGAAALHDCGLLHLDLKGDNAKVTMQADGRQLKLMTLDLGSVRPTGCCKS